MNIAPPTEQLINATIANSERALQRIIGRRRIVTGAAIGTGALVVLGIAGTGAAAAFFPQYWDLQGVVKTSYAHDFVDCIRAAGWDARILDPAEGDPIITSWGLDPATHTAVTSHLLQSTQGQSGRAISLCQQELSEKVGEPIVGEPN